jgi:hypothetical protein
MRVVLTEYAHVSCSVDVLLVIIMMLQEHGLLFETYTSLVDAIYS